MGLRDDIEKSLAEAHAATPYGRRLSAGDSPILANMAVETLAQAVQHLLFVSVALERAVTKLAEAVEPERS